MHAELREKGDRPAFDAEAVYRIVVHKTEGGYVASEPRGTTEAVGDSPADAVANYAVGIRGSSHSGDGQNTKG